MRPGTEVAGQPIPPAWRYWPVAGVPALPAMFWLRDLPVVGVLQYQDYYGILGRVVDGQRFTWDPLRWLSAGANEHKHSISALLYALNVQVSSGDNRVLSLLSILLTWTVAVIVAAMILRGRRPGAGANIGVPLVVSALLFTPAGAQNIVMGFSGVIWFLGDLFAVAAMASLIRPETGQAAGGYARAYRPAAFGILGALTHSTHLALWPALLLGGFVARCRGGALAVVGAAAALAGGAQWLVYTRPGHFPTPSYDVGILAGYVGRHLGAPLAEDPRAAAVIGWAGTAIFIVGVLEAVRLREPRLAPFVMLSAYGFVNGLATGSARSGFGVELEALSSRYASISMLFWIGVLGIVAWSTGRMMARLVSPRYRARGTLAAFTATLAVALVVSTWLRGMVVHQKYMDLAAWNPVAAMALRHDVRDEQALSLVGLPSRAEDRSWLRRIKHVPFAVPLRIPPRDPVDPALLVARPDPRVAGYFDGLLPVGNGGFRAQGWAFARGVALDEALLLDGAGVVRGELVIGTPRPDVAASPGYSDAPRYCGVTGYVLPGETPGPLRIYVRLKDDRRYVALVGEHRVPASGGS